jgi:hypothetical protein
MKKNVEKYRRVLRRYKREYSLLRTRYYLLSRAKKYYQLAKRARDPRKRKYYVALGNYYYKLYLKHVRKYPVVKKPVKKPVKKLPDWIIPVAAFGITALL